MKLSAVLKGAVMVALAGAIFASPPLRELATSLETERIEIWLGRAGVFAPLLFMVIMAVAVVVSPIPSLPLDVAAGAVFGPVLGTAYAVVGALSGAVASFWIARLLGRDLIQRVLGGHINFCTACSDKLLTRIVLLSRLLPFVSFDIVSYGAGLTKMSTRRFALATGIGMIPLTFLYTSFGSLVSFGSEVTLPIGALMVLLFFLVPRWIERRNPFGMASHFHHPEDDS